ncbi:hypothetical protein PR003_g33620 [Phytophthora rubi]|uniref:Glutaredoxin domain-containing protein n=1 Tax=Phytophthora rubi TaxID=129364 RepID=A0A6A3GC68_9STRA|nr:hypothetical protein PR001_g32430 [Phytophthora rubi]KAE8954663.1 hypothetical protein PR002_g32024 [Phytophthora rubi]KAE9262218.1 hypothetical protein PR003_g33620 [Phytophthora rubi]
MVSAKETVEAKIAASPVVVYSKSYCPYCTKTKTLFLMFEVYCVTIPTAREEL